MPRYALLPIYLCFAALLLTACGGSTPQPAASPAPTLSSQGTAVRTQPAPEATTTAVSQPTAAEATAPATMTPSPATPSTQPAEIHTPAATMTRAPASTEQAEPAATVTPTEAPTARPTAPEVRPTQAPATQLAGIVTDSATGKPVADAYVYLGDRIARTNEQGRYKFSQEAGDNTLTVMAPGYSRFTARAASLPDGRTELAPFEARGVFMPFRDAVDSSRVEELFDLIDSSVLNSIVIDVKSDSGEVWRSNVPLAKEIGASQDDMDLRAFVERAHERGIYVIGRFVVFRDPTTANEKPEWAIKSTEGGLWQDYSEIEYVDPFNEEAWEYFGDLAVDMAAQGLDEIQYDYVRFPVDGDLDTTDYLEDSTRESRVETITSFARYMEGRIRPAKMYISADIFGLTVWSQEEEGTGQIFEKITQHLDYASPMLYPSGFGGYFEEWDAATEHSYDLIRRSMKLAVRRSKGINVRVRPFLQSFSDYEWGKPYGLPQYLEQRRAAEEWGATGWLYWNADGEYDPGTFVEKP